MVSWQLIALNLALRYVVKPQLGRVTDFRRARSRLNARSRRFGAKVPVHSWSEGLRAEGHMIPALRLAGPMGGPTVFWLHGGAYCIGSGRTHAAMVAALARRIGAGAVLPDYRLAPEHCFPAAVEDAMTAWKGLLAEGVDPARVVLGGDSAGGGLAFALLHLILKEGGPAPGCVLTFSPWTDLTLSGASLRDLADKDPMLPAWRAPEIRDNYLGGADMRDPRASPMLGRFRGGPPCFLQTSRDEILRDDSIRMAARLEEDGVAVTLDLWEGTPHVWQFHVGRLPEADAAMDGAAAFARSALGHGRVQA